MPDNGRLSFEEKVVKAIKYRVVSRLVLLRNPVTQLSNALREKLFAGHAAQISRNSFCGIKGVARLELICYTSYTQQKVFLTETRSHAAKARESCQVRKEAAVSGVFWVPWESWVSVKNTFFCQD